MSSLSSHECELLQRDIKALFEGQKQITALRAQVKAANEQNRQISDAIMQRMLLGGVQACNVGSFKLVVETKRKMPALNAKMIEPHLKNLFHRLKQGDEDLLRRLKRDELYEDFMQRIQEERQEKSTESQTLSRKAIRAKKSAQEELVAAAKTFIPTPPVTVADENSLSSNAQEVWN
jgi:hypothetical protein